MPEGDFEKDIELAKLQAKISKEQTDAYTTFAVCITAAIGLIAFAFTSPAYVVSGNFAALLFIGLACVILIRWGRFQPKIKRDFDKIYRREKIDLDD